MVTADALFQQHHGRARALARSRHEDVTRAYVAAWCMSFIERWNLGNIGRITWRCFRDIRRTLVVSIARARALQLH